MTRQEFEQALADLLENVAREENIGGYYGYRPLSSEEALERAQKWLESHNPSF